ncbi:hypothetical protein Lal_00041520 [Lupinus albus]|nr:hypothetical protein Lal_00041520 [Lupinus albus]
MKSILICFELVSRLKVNFNKISLIGIRVDNSFMTATTTSFVSCKIGFIPFLYLGIPVGANLGTIQRSKINKRDRKGIPWIACLEMCKPKRLDGLGIKDLTCFNVVLSGKWTRLVDYDAL